MSLSDEVIFKIDIPANRYDLFCEEGLVRALKLFIGRDHITLYRLHDATYEMIVEESVGSVRPYVACAILRNISFENDDVYDSFIALQTKLHTTVCRKRTLASIGTHDLDTIKGPFYYRALPPNEIKFIPLNRDTVVDGHQLMELLKSDQGLSPFLDIIRDKPLYPVIYDSNNVVLSLPPIINGEHSKITKETKNVLIEVTATDETKANVALNVMVTMFSEYCQEKFNIEQVKTIYPGDSDRLYPHFDNREIKAEIDYLSRGIGIELNPQDVVGYLEKMGIPADLSDDHSYITARITPTRSDIFHKCDLVEDCAIGYGFNRIPKRLPTTYTNGTQYTKNYISDKIRGEVARNGYTELLNFSLLSFKENYTNLKLKSDGLAVELSNPATTEFEIVRTNLMAGILMTVASNKDESLPLRVFELSDIVVIDPNSEVGARNNRELCAIYCDSSSRFEMVHGLLNRLMTSLNLSWKDNTRGYILRASDNPTFLEGRRGDVIAIINGKEYHVGTLGVVHPEVINNFGLLCACSALCLNIQFFIDN